MIGNALDHRKTSLGDVAGSAIGGCVAGLAGFGLGKVLEIFAKPVTEGIYEVVAESGLRYVGQSSDITARLAPPARGVGQDHAGSCGAAIRTAVLGGKTAREIAEQLRIKDLGGVDVLENIRNPIGEARKGLLQTFDNLDEYLSWLNVHL